MRSPLVVAVLLSSVAATGCSSHPATPSAAELSLSAQSHDFGASPVGGQSAPLRFSVVNHGEAPSGILSVFLEGPSAAEFALTRDQCSGQALQEATTCNVEVALRPASAGDKEATLTVSDPRGEGVSAALRGNGADAGLGIAPAINTFEQTAVGSQSAVQTLVVHNTSVAATGSIQTAVTGAQSPDFQITRDTCKGKTLALGGSCVIDVRFAPTAIGPRQATVTISASPGGSANAALAGVGRA